MADQRQFQAGETKAHAEEKTGQMMEKGSDAAEEAKGRAVGGVQTVKDRASVVAGAAKDKAGGAAESARETAREGKERAGGILQQTGEQVKSMAQGAADAVKSTLGMGGGDKEKH
ncbi:unnamed protein product [Victoria cruziana]